MNHVNYAPQLAQSAPDPRGRPAKQTGRHVVVVDDEPQLLQLVCDILKSEGYQVTCYERALTVLELAGTISASLFLIDLMMPEMSGLELARRLAYAKTPGVPMIAVSASDEMLQEARTSDLFQDFVRKPFELTRLLDSVGRYVA